MKYLSRETYEEVLLAVLRRQGIPDAAAKALIAARWPMLAPGLVCEAFGRGLLVDVSDVAAFCTLPGGESVDQFLFTPEVAELFFDWAIEQGRARLSVAGECHQHDDAREKVIRNVCRQGAAGLN